MSRICRKKVFVGLSGGVDSSISAALLKKAATPKDFEKIFGRPSLEGFRGYDVTGVFIRVWNPASEQGSTLDREKGRTLFGLCQAADDRLDAMRVCAKLGIPFKELNLEKEYKKEVVDYMIREYKSGRTPNPDVFCNRFIKFGGFYKWAMEQGADFIATGHYAQVSRILSNGRISNQTRISGVKDKGLRIKDFGLFAGSDRQKDQSYFLWQIRKEQLPHILFPVGGMKKPEVRKLAKRFGLITADKKDSQGLCFVGKVDMKEFLSHYIRPKRGDVLDEQGRVIGKHTGAFFYTVGERMGGNLSPSSKVENERGWFVVAKDMRKNTLTVSHKSPSGELPRARKEVVISDCNWLTEPKVGKTYSARVRYRQPLQACHLAITSGRGLLLKQTAVVFGRPQTVAAGQSLVLYDGGVLVGGGIIS